MGKVILIHTNPEVKSLIRAAFGEKGDPKVLVAESGEALQRLLPKRPRAPLVVLVGELGSDKPSADIAQLVRERAPEAPVVVLTAWAREEVEWDPDLFVRMPFSPLWLREEVLNLLSGQ